jgi:hypothetical protein
MKERTGKRSNRRSEQQMGGKQTITGPILMIPIPEQQMAWLIKKNTPGSWPISWISILRYRHRNVTAVFMR